MKNHSWDAIIVGGGIAGLSAAIYLGRAMRKTLVIDAGHSLARWEGRVENYLGFREIDGEELLKRGRSQAEHYKAHFADDEIIDAAHEGDGFVVRGKKEEYRAKRLLLATGLFHLPPEIPHVDACLGHSMFFCKDCDGWRVQGKRIAIIGNTNETAEYALGMLHYSPCVIVATNGKRSAWDEQHAAWLKEYEISFYCDRIKDVDQSGGMLTAICFESGSRVLLDALFTTRGDVFHNKIGKALGAKLDDDGQLVVDSCKRTSVKGVYAAGCVTPANCQMIISAGDGATAAQSINRDIFEEQLHTHHLMRFREEQLRTSETDPPMTSGTRLDIPR